MIEQDVVSTVQVMSTDPWVIASTIAAAFSATCAAYQIFKSNQWNRLDRTFSHSTYKSPEYVTARKTIDREFPDWRNQQRSTTYELIMERLNESSDTRHAFLVMLNHWGRMASEYQAGLLDENKAEELYKHALIQFDKAFSEYPKQAKNSKIYKNYIKLAQLWRNKK